jgi:hypothetical protein
VIEGVRLLPWLQEAERSRPGAVEMFTDCEACMRANPPEIRKGLACGYLPPVATSELTAAGGRPDGFRGEMTTCIGYTTKLPEVIETSRARLHWEKGTLQAWAGGEPTDPLLLALEELECQQGAVQAHVIDTARRSQS